MRMIRKRQSQKAFILQRSTIWILLLYTVCSYGIRVFEEMAKAFRQKHDPFIWIDNELKPQFRNVFKNAYYKEANKDLRAVITLCKQLEDPIKNSVIDSLTLLVVEEIRGEYPWIKTKPTFIGKVPLEIGEGL